MRFDGLQTQITGRGIASAILELQPWILPGDFNTTYRVNAISTAWNPATVTWNSAPLVITTGELVIPPPTTTAVPIRIDVTNFVRNWASGAWPNYGIFLRENDAFLPPDTALRQTSIYSLEIYPNAGARPHLIITFN